MNPCKLYLKRKIGIFISDGSVLLKRQGKFSAALNKMILRFGNEQKLFAVNN